MKHIYTTLAALLFMAGAYAQSYSKIKTIGGGRDAAVAFSIGNKFYIGGGGGYKDFWVYNPDSNNFRQLGDLPGVGQDRGFGIAFSTDTKGYVGLGTDSTPNVLKKDLWEYNPLNDSWTRKADLPGTARDGCGVFVVNNKAYIIGGSDNVYIYADCYEYDPAMDTWTQKNALPAANIFPACFTIGNKGYITTGATSTEYKETYEYDPANDMWTAKADFPVARQTAVGFSIKGKGYVGLGQSGYTKVYKDMYVYDPVADTWGKTKDFGGKARAWACAASNNDKAIIGFGWDFGSSFTNDIWLMDPNWAAGVEHTTAQENGMHIYPNPSQNGTATVQLATTPVAGGSLIVYDMNGKKVAAQLLTAIQTVYTFSGLPAGIYTVQYGSNTQQWTQKLVVNK